MTRTTGKTARAITPGHHPAPTDVHPLANHRSRAPRFPDKAHFASWIAVRGDRRFSECSGCGLEDFDGALRPGRSCEFLVAGEQGGVHGFSEGDVGRVVDGEVVP